MKNIKESIFGKKSSNNEEILRDDVFEDLLKYYKEKWDLEGVKKALSTPYGIWSAMADAGSDLGESKSKYPYWSQKTDDAIDKFNGPQSNSLTENDLEQIPIYHSFKHLLIAAKYIF